MKTKKSTDEDLNVYSLTRSHYGLALSYTMMYGMIVAVCLGLSYFFMPLMLVLIPFIIVPFTFALHASIASLNGRQPYSLGSFFKNFALYYNRHFFGGYRIIHGLIKTLIVFLIVLEISSLPTIINLLNDQSFYQQLEAIATYEEMIELLMNNEAYMLGSNIASVIAVGFASFILIHHIITNGIKETFAIHDDTIIDMRVISFIHHRKAFRKYRKDFYGTYFRYLWYLYILYPLFFAGGALLCYFVIRQDFNLVIFFGELFGFVLLLPFMPLIVNVVEVATLSNYDSFIIGASEFTKEQLETLLISGNLSEEDKAKIKGQLEEIDESIKKAKEIEDDEE